MIITMVNHMKKEIEGNLPKGVKSVEASYDGGRGRGRGRVWVGFKHVLDNLGAGDYDVSHNGIRVSVNRERFYYGGEDFDFKDLSAGLVMISILFSNKSKK